MKKLFFSVNFAFTFLCASGLLAQTDIVCFKNDQLCQSILQCTRFPWISSPDTLLPGRLVILPKDEQLNITISGLVRDPVDGIPPEKIVLHGTTVNFFFQDSILIVDAIMQGYNEFHFHMRIQLKSADAEKFLKFQKETKLLKKKK